MFRPLFKKYGCLGPIAASIFLTPFLALAQGLTVELPKPVAAMATQQPLVGYPVFFKPYHENSIYALTDKVGWTVTPVPGASCLHFKYTFKKFNATLIGQGTLDLTSGSAKIEVRVHEPATILAELIPTCLIPPPTIMIDPKAPCDLRCGEVSVPKPRAILAGAVVAPRQIHNSEPKPADFDAFWQAKLDEMAKLPMNPVLIPTANNNPDLQLYTFKLDALNSHVQGYLAKPGKPGKYPAVITYEWAGVHQLNPGTVLGPARDGWIAMNVDSHDLPPYEDKAAPEVMDYANQFPNDREKNYFLNMFLRDSRAVDYIASLPEWDGKTILVRGGSLGGWQGLVTAGLNPHVTHVLVEDPVGTDLNGARHGRTTAHPYWNSTNPEIAKTTPYFDAVNFSTRSHAITLSAIGFIDRSAPASGVWAALNAIHAPTEPILMQERTHDQGQSPWTDQPSRIRSAEVMDLLHLGKPLVVHEPEGTNKHE